MKLTQVQLAKLAKVSQATVSDYENDVTTDYRAAQLMRIAAALQTTPEYLLTGSGPEQLKDATSQQDHLLAAFDKLTQDQRAALIAAAKAMSLTSR